jgi:hypothetical protein
VTYNSDLYITISSSAKENLIRHWGQEVVLRCSCGDRPSHSMWGQYGRGTCPVCRETCLTISHRWGVIEDGS